MLRKWLKAGYIETGKLFPTDAGTPQGGIISPTLANVTLDGLEAELTTHFGSKGSRQAGKCKVNLVRYADDFVITGARKSYWKTKSDHWWRAFSLPVAWNSHPRKPGRRISRKGSISSARTCGASASDPQGPRGQRYQAGAVLLPAVA